jgi:hypothetical protein
MTSIGRSGRRTVEQIRIIEDRHATERRGDTLAPASEREPLPGILPAAATQLAHAGARLRAILT